jgi:Cytochrome c7 and related cytochrome c/Class III cytochrome C family
MWRLALVLLPALALAAGVFILTVGTPFLLASQPNPAPRQPIAFDHQLHGQVVGIDCAFCHRSAASGVAAGLPDLQQCMGCHAVVGQGEPEVDKLRQAWASQQAIEWVRAHRLPDHTRFTHEAHVQAGIGCATCHGDVASMHQVSQVRSLKMNDCVACHQQTNAPTECVTCHY